MYAFIGLRSLLQLDRSYDTMTVHLPRALSMFELTTMELPSRAILRNMAFPPLISYLQGFFVYTSGRISTANFVAFLGFFVMVAIIKIMFQRTFSVRWFLTMCLAVPLLILHLGSTMTDLFTNCMITVAFAGLIKMRQEIMNEKRIGLSALVVILGSLASMLSKMQAWPVIGLFTAYAIMLVIFHMRKDAQWNWKNIGLVMCLVVAFAFYPTRNFILLGNPTFPVQPPFVSTPLPSYREAAARQEPYVPLRDKSNIYKFVFSALELNRIVQPQDYDGWLKVMKENVIHIRIGGWFFLTVILAGTFFLLGILGIPKDILALHALSSLFFANLPGSFYLRYSFFILLNCFLLFEVYKESLPAWHNSLARKTLGLSAAIVLATQMKGYWKINTALPMIYAPSNIRTFWKENAQNKRETFVRGKAGDYNGLFWAGPTFKEFHIKLEESDPLTMEDILKELAKKNAK